MKFRTSFVANSSSSSFIAIGVKDVGELEKKFFMTEDLDDYDLVYDDAGNIKPKKGVKLPKDTICCNYEGVGTVIGKVWANWSDDGEGFELKNITLKEISKYAEEFKDTFGVEPYIIGGTYCS